MKETFAKKDIKVNRAEFIDKNIMQIEYCENNVDYKLKFNVQTGRTHS